MLRPRVSDESFRLMRTAESRGYVSPANKADKERCRSLHSIGVFEEYDALPGAYCLTTAGQTFYSRVEKMREVA
jgi:hypothetical protein